MCGITGFVGDGDEQDLHAMMAALVHRGPDGECRFIDPDQRVFLGHLRLAIVDIEGGQQPMWNEDGRIGIIFNGEIYNHLELRSELVRQGHVFRSHHSDTEVLVHGYEQWGQELPGRLNGMFAFAIYDRRKQLLFLARDRFGEKPLYYALQKGLFAFASELRALVCHRKCNPQVDVRSLQKFFAHGFFPAPNTMLRDVFKLPGGSSLTFELETLAVRVNKYWQFKIQPDDSCLHMPEAELAAKLRQLLSQAVQRRLMSDVPLGVFLSGGIDSCAMLAMAANHSTSKQISTFTIGFKEPSYDESNYARRAAALFNSNHREEVIGVAEARELIPRVMHKIDEPLGDPSILPTYLLSALARRDVTVALSGDGGDELFAGYDPFAALGLANIVQRLVPKRLVAGCSRLADLLPISRANMSLDFKIRRGLSGLAYPSELWNPVWLAPLQTQQISDLFQQPVDVEDIYSEVLANWRNSECTNIGDKSLEFYSNFYLQDNILPKSDRAAMLVSLEARAPFLDNDLVDFVRRLPYQLKYRRGNRKYLLKQSLAEILPPAILARPKKGFGIPVAEWLRELPISAERLPLHNSAWVQQRWREHRDNKADHRLFLWGCLGLQHSVGAKYAEQIGDI